MTDRSPRRIGVYLEADADGYLQCVAKDRPVQVPWDAAVTVLVRWYQAALGERLHSVYVRGSVAKGMAIEGVSDLDSFAVLTQSAAALGPVSFGAWAGEVETEFIRKFPFVARVEIGTVPFEAVADGAGPDAFVLKVESVCVYGKDLAERIEPFKLGPGIAFQTRCFRRHLGTFLREYPAEPSAGRPAFLVWILRRFLRLGMELVMVEERRYTRDLYLCFESFAKHYETEARLMYRALELAVDPVVDEEAEVFVRSFGEWLADEADRKLEGWGLEGLR